MKPEEVFKFLICCFFITISSIFIPSYGNINVYILKTVFVIIVISLYYLCEVEYFLLTVNVIWLYYLLFYDMLAC